jgi:hypothetical protein
MMGMVYPHLLVQVYELEDLRYHIVYSFRTHHCNKVEDSTIGDKDPWLRQVADYTGAINRGLNFEQKKSHRSQGGYSIMESALYAQYIVSTCPRYGQILDFSATRETAEILCTIIV